MRVVQSTAAKITLPTVTDLDENPAAASATACAGVNAAGSALSAITVSAGTGTGVYYATLTSSHTANLNRLTLTTTATVSGNTQTFVQTVDVIGAHYVTIADLRAEPDMSDTDKYPTSLLRELRDRFEDFVESVTGTAWVPRYNRVQLDGDGTNTLMLPDLHPRTLVSVTIDGVAQSTSGFTLYDEGLIVRETTSFPKPNQTNGPRNVVVEYTFGYDAPPSQLRREALSTIRMWALQRKAKVQSNAIGDDATRYIPADYGAQRPSGIPTLDAVLADLNEKRPAVG